MINLIAFKNFRKFKEFPATKLGPITMLVGKNNAGKSTIVKALILAYNFLKSEVRKDMDGYGYMLADFKLDAPHVNVMTFNRAFCNDSPEKEDTIMFSLGVERFVFNIFVRGDRKKSSWYDVPRFEICDTKNNIVFMIDYSSKEMSVNFLSNGNEDRIFDKNTDIIKDNIEELKVRLTETTDLEEADSINLEISKLEKKLQLQNNASKDQLITIELMNYVSENWGELLVPDLVKGFVEYARPGKTRKERIIKEHSTVLTDIANDLKYHLSRLDIEYIFAHSVNPQTTYNMLNAHNDYFTGTIHDFYKIRRNIDTNALGFLKKWMKEFDVGYDVHINFISGESYQVLIQNNEDDTEEEFVNLADKGMGAIQMLSLLMRLATLIHYNPAGNLSIMLEEPEQNLHPAFQSKLADMFHELGDMDFQLIVETHSEYIIRKTQVLVAKFKYKNDDELFEENPFKVYYLPDNGSDRYEMRFSTNGRFKDKFDKGFFDVSSDLAFEIF